MSGSIKQGALIVTEEHDALLNARDAAPGVAKGHVTAEAQQIDGVKTFLAIPELPDEDPTTDNQAARKKYVDDERIALEARAKAYALVLG
jgi:hypothetical protein